MVDVFGNMNVKYKCQIQMSNGLDIKEPQCCQDSVQGVVQGPPHVVHIHVVFHMVFRLSHSYLFGTQADSYPLWLKYITCGFCVMITL
jgi:hypothetical protein